MKKLIFHWRFWGLVALYVITTFFSAFIGFLSPWCWIVGFPALAAFLGAFSYQSIALHCSNFGVATLLSFVLGGLLALLGECELWQSFIMLAIGLISDLIRKYLVSDSRITYPFLSVGVIAWILKLWTDPDWYVTEAISEMGNDYANILGQLSNYWYLLLVIVITFIMGYIGICIYPKES